MRIRPATSIVLTVLFVAACSTIHVGTDVYEPFSFEGHDTFTWASDHPMVASSPDVSPFAEDRIKQAISEALQTKGVRYVSDPAQARLLVAFSLSEKQKISVTPATYPGPYWGPYPWVGNYYNTVDVREYSVGRLTIDVFDTEDKQPVWHGWATKTLGDDGGHKGEGAAKAATLILANFPSVRAPNT